MLAFNAFSFHTITEDGIDIILKSIPKENLDEAC
jgi:hypothetical protein